MLSQESYLRLTNLFTFRKIPAGLGKNGTIRKFAMPIGWNELTIKKVERKERWGKEIVEITIYLPPADEVYCQELKEKMSFAPIICRHVVAKNAVPGLVRKWFKTSSALTPTEAEEVMGWKGKKFNGLISHHQELLTRGDEILRNKDGWRVTYWKQEIVAVLPIGRTAEVNYFDLVRYAPNDQVIKQLEIAPF